MSAVTAGPRQHVGVLDVVLSWTAGLVGYLVAEYGAGGLLALAVAGGGPEALPAWTWLPWIAGPVLCGVLAAAVLPRQPAPRWWHWPLVGGAVPLLAAPVSWLVAGPAADGQFVLGVGVQVVVAVGAALAVALVRRAADPWLAARRRPAEPPPSYV